MTSVSPSHDRFLAAFGIAGIVILPFLVFYPVAALIVWLTHLSPARPFFASSVSVNERPFTGRAIDDGPIRDAIASAQRRVGT